MCVILKQLRLPWCVRSYKETLLETFCWNNWEIKNDKQKKSEKINIRKRVYQSLLISDVIYDFVRDTQTLYYTIYYTLIGFPNMFSRQSPARKKRKKQTTDTSYIAIYITTIIVVRTIYIYIAAANRSAIRPRPSAHTHTFPRWTIIHIIFYDYYVSKSTNKLFALSRDKHVFVFFPPLFPRTDDAHLDRCVPHVCPPFVLTNRFNYTFFSSYARARVNLDVIVANCGFAQFDKLTISFVQFSLSISGFVWDFGISNICFKF